MYFRIADTLTDSLSLLTGDEQEAVINKNGVSSETVSETVCKRAHP